MSLTVGQWPEPGAKDIDVTKLFSVCKMMKAATPLGRNDTGRVVWETGEYRDLMSGAGPVMSKFGCARRGRAHFRRKVLGHVKDFHVKVKVIAEPAVESNMCSEAMDLAATSNSRLVVAELERCLVQQGAGAVHAAVRVGFPAISNLCELLFIC